MKFINDQCQSISLVVLVCFSALLFFGAVQVQAAPARGTAEKTIEQGENDAPSFIEQESDSEVKVKNKKIPWLIVGLGVVAIGVAVYFLLIKKSEYTLAVKLGEGASGTPATGTKSYKKGEAVSYNYSKLSGYGQLSVKLDGVEVAASGTITMNRDHTLDVTAMKIGTITSVNVKFDLIFAGNNLICTNGVTVNGINKIDETFHFLAHESDSYEDSQIARSFTMALGLGDIRINQVADASYSSVYSGEDSSIYSTYYVLSVLSYTYSDGADPGTPTLSESSFYLNVSPFTPGNNFSRSEWKTIYLNAASQQGVRLKKPVTKCHRHFSNKTE